MKTNYTIIIFLLSISFLSCDLKDLSSVDSILGSRDSLVHSEITKWYDGHTAAIVITNDAGITGQAEMKVQTFAANLNIPINYEMITADFLKSTEKINVIKTQLLPNGHDLFGHGHKHVNHDLFSYTNAFNSFKRCYNVMDSLGLTPVAYAYPGGNGYKLSTRKALKDAGFLAGRYFDQIGHLDPYIVPYNNLDPKDWFALPTLVMQDYNYDACDICINNTEELIPFLDETLNQKALLTITYHAIGQTGAYGFYNLENFQQDLLAIKERDFWIARFDDAVLYLYERKNAQAEVIWHYTENEVVNKISVSISDGISDNKRFNQPLTLVFDIPKYWKDKTYSTFLNGQKIHQDKVRNSRLKISLLPNENIYSLELEHKNY